MGKRRVMVVDDEKDFLKVTELNLGQTGKYDVLTLSSAKDILSRVNSFKPDVILLDVLMPEISGIDACEMLNNDPAAKNIPIIIISALEKDKEQLKAYKVGVVDYIVKPAEISNIIAKIEKALASK